jgi:hypothetical protein
MNADEPSRAAEADSPELTELARALRVLQRALFDFPIASQAAFSALVAEGRSFARTAEGKEWEERLRDSELVARGRVAWEVLTQSAFTEDEQTVLPSVILDAFARTTAINALEPFLSVFFEEKGVKP